jgi:hsp70-interacting protein
MSRTCTLACSVVAVLLCLQSGSVRAVNQSASSAIGAIGALAPASNDMDTAAAPSSDEPSIEGPSGPTSLDDMLRWAILHSDPEQLKAMASAQETDAGSDSVAVQQARVAELVQAMKQQPSEADLMREAVAILRDHNATVDELHRALQALQYLVEPIDNANNLGGMNGIDAVMGMLDRPDDKLQAAAAGVIGTASSNNVVFQQHLMDADPQAMAKLLELVAADSSATADKALYAVAALVRNLPSHRAAFHESQGFAALQHALQGAGSSLLLKRRALNLITDLLVLEQGRQVGSHEDLEGLVGSVIGVLIRGGYGDVSVHEEALLALKEIALSPNGMQLMAAQQAEIALRYYADRVDASDSELHETLTTLCMELLDLLSSTVTHEEL